MPNIPQNLTADTFIQLLNTLEPAVDSPIWGGRLFKADPLLNRDEAYSFDTLLTVFQKIQDDPTNTPSKIESCRLKLQALDHMDWNDPHPYLTEIKTAVDEIFAYVKRTHLSKEKLLNGTPAVSQPNKMAMTAKKIAYYVPAFLIFLIMTPALLIPQVWTTALLPATLNNIPNPDLVSANNLVAGRRTEFDFQRNDGPTLKAMFIKTRGEQLQANVVSHAPVAVLFCQNANMMQDDEMLKRANQYNELGFNVVLFNYRGVGGSKGTPTKGQDLIDDGKSIVQAIQQGKIKGLGAIPDQDIVLDGTSIGGAVALAVGKEHPKMLVAANHTFSNWSAAAGSVVTHKTHAIVGIASQWLAACSRRAASLDNVKSLKARPRGSVTIIQTAGKDELLNEQSRLRVRREQEGVEEEFLDGLGHGSMPPLQSDPNSFLPIQEPIREKLKAKLQIIAERHADAWQKELREQVHTLKQVSEYAQMNRLPDLLETLRILKFAQNGRPCDLQYVQEVLSELEFSSIVADHNALQKCQNIVEECNKR